MESAEWLLKRTGNKTGKTALVESKKRQQHATLAAAVACAWRANGNHIQWWAPLAMGYSLDQWWLQYLGSFVDGKNTILACRSGNDQISFLIQILILFTTLDKISTRYVSELAFMNQQVICND